MTNDSIISLIKQYPLLRMIRYALTANTVTCKMMTHAGYLEHLRFPLGTAEERNRVQEESYSHYLVEIVDADPKKPFSPDKFITALIHDSKAQSDLNMFFDSLYLVHKMAEDINNFYRDFWPVADCE